MKMNDPKFFWMNSAKTSILAPSFAAPGVRDLPRTGVSWQL